MSYGEGNPPNTYELRDNWNLNNSLEGNVNFVSEFVSGNFVKTAATSKQMRTVFSGSDSPTNNTSKLKRRNKYIMENTSFATNDSIARSTVEKNYQE